MTVYEDRRGYRYKVMQDLSGRYCPRGHSPDRGPEVGWKTCKAFTPRETREEAERDLDAWAMRKGMAIVGSVS